MKTARFLTLASALLGALALVTIWQASAQQPVKENFPLDKVPYDVVIPYLGVQGGGTFAAPGNGNPELAKLQGEEIAAEHMVNNLLRDYSRSTDEAMRGKLKTQLSAALEKQFDIQQQRRDLEAARIEAQLKKLRDLMKKRTDARQTIVEKRLDQLVREADGLGWTAPAAPQSLPGNGFAGPRPASGLQLR